VAASKKTPVASLYKNYSKKLFVFYKKKYVISFAFVQVINLAFSSGRATEEDHKRNNLVCCTERS
jgi:hypothetical protein